MFCIFDVIHMSLPSNNFIVYANNRSVTQRLVAKKIVHAIQYVYRHKSTSILAQSVEINIQILTIFDWNDAFLGYNDLEK